MVNPDPDRLVEVTPKEVETVEPEQEAPVKKKRGRKKNIYNTNVEVVNLGKAKKGTLTIKSSGIGSSNQMSFTDIFKPDLPEEEKKNKAMTAQDRCIIHGLNKTNVYHTSTEEDIKKHNDDSNNNSEINTPLGGGTKEIDNDHDESHKKINTHACWRETRNISSLTNSSADLIHNTCTFSIEHYRNKTDVLCWYCCHKFDTYPVPLPISLQKKLGKRLYNVMGNFCSFNCAKSYTLYNIKTYNTYEISSLLSILNKSLNKVIHPITCAPKRELLKSFGGILDIDTFRNMSGNTRNKMDICTDNIIPINMKIYESDLNKINNTDGCSSNNDKDKNLILYRKKPIKNKNTLESAMGLKKLVS